MSLNAVLASYLLELRDEHDPDSNRYRTYNKAYNNLRKYTEDILLVEQAGHVHGVGKTILGMLTRRLDKERGFVGAVPGPSHLPAPTRQAPKSFTGVLPEDLLDNPFFHPSMLNGLGGAADAGPSTSRARGRGRGRGAAGGTRGAGRGRGKRARVDEALVEEDEEVQRPAKRRSPPRGVFVGHAVRDDPDSWAVPAQATGEITAPPIQSTASARFWYLDTTNARVPHFSLADIHVVPPFVLRKVELPLAPSVPGPLPQPFKAIYLEGQPIWSKTTSTVGWLEEDRLLEKGWEACNGFEIVVPAPPPPVSRKTSAAAPPPPKPAQRAAPPAPPKDDLASLLAQENRTKIRTLDPSRTVRSRTDAEAPADAAPPALARATSSPQADFTSDPVNARRAAADAAMRREQAAKPPSDSPAAPVSKPKVKGKAPARTASMPEPAVSASTSLPVPPARTVSAPVAPAPRPVAPSASFPAFQPIIIPANTYDILLILDNREIGRYGNREAIRDGLEKLGVQVEQRALAVGDTLWVARSTSSGRECVLNWIVERKRLDDLCASIKDSRFQDQKFRLAQSALTHVFYLVEHFAVQRLMRDNELMINTALSRTQIVDEFQVKETRTQQETIEFLANMHSAIRTILDGQALYVLPSNVLARPTYSAFQVHLRESQPDIEYLTSWADFQVLNGKNATRTVGETWARMLLCVKGLSAERVSKILEHHGSAREMWNAYRISEQAEAQALAQGASETAAGAKGKGKKKAVAGPKSMLAELGGEGRRKIGDALSEKIWEVVMSRSYL